MGSRKWDRVLDSLLSGSPVEWIAFLAVASAILAAIWAVARYRASLRGDADPAAADSLLVRQVRELRDRGEVSDSEYRSLKGRLRPSAEDPSVGGAAGGRDRKGPAD
jgi:hypothetical protein